MTERFDKPLSEFEDAYDDEFDVIDSEECRRCAECKGLKHHWMSNPSFGLIGYQIGKFTHVCKHCSAMGSECNHCSGTGAGAMKIGSGIDASPEYDDCQLCNGEGVLEGKEIEL